MIKINQLALLLALFSVLSANSAFAQSTTFKLSDYKNPDYLYQALDLNFGLNSGMNVNRIDNSQDYSTKYFSLNSGTGAIYSRYANSPKSQSEKHISFNAGIGTANARLHYKSNGDELKNNSFSHHERIEITAVKRFYNLKQNYFEVNGSLDASNQGNSGNNQSNYAGITNSEDNSQKHFTNFMTGAFLIGKGRIEQVQDARLAMYLLDDLKRLNRAQRAASDEEVIALAQLITTLKYKRFFDTRLRKIAEITAIDLFLQNNHIAGNPDATYFTSLNDNWDFANNPIRYSGQRIFTGIEAEFGYDNNNNYRHEILPNDNVLESRDKLETSGLFLVAGKVYEKPKSLKWQNSASFKAGIGMRQQSESQKVRNDLTSDTDYNYYNEAFPAIKLAAEYGFGYYPTSRTWLTFKWWLLSGWEKQLAGTTSDDKADFQNSMYANTGPQLQASYYLSEKLRLSFTFNGEFRFNHDKFTNDIPAGSGDSQTNTLWNQQVNASLAYSLF